MFWISALADWIDRYRQRFGAAPNIWSAMGYNVADVFIFAGALGLIVFDAREGARTTDNAPKKGQGKNAP